MKKSQFFKTAVPLATLQLCHCQNWEFLDTANIHLDAVECFWTSRKLITSLWFSVDTCASCTVHPQTTVSICTREKQSWMSKRSFQKFGELMKFLWWKRKCSPDQSENSISLKLPYNLPADSFIKAAVTQQAVAASFVWWMPSHFMVQLFSACLCGWCAAMATTDTTIGGKW